MNDEVVLRTGRLYEADMLADALDRAGIPYYRREDSFTGLEVAMPAMPAPGPGVIFTVMVPHGAADDARGVLATLPVEGGNPGLWSFSPRPWAKRVIQVFVILVLALLAMEALGTLVKWIG